MPHQDTAAPADDVHQTRRTGELDAHIGNRLRLRRLMLNMSQEQLGGMVGLTFQQIQKYEKGANRISAVRLFEFANALSVPFEYFFEDRPISAAPKASDQFSVEEAMLAQGLLTRDGFSLMKAYLRITNPSVRRCVVSLVRSLAGEEADAKVIPAGS